LKQARRNVNLEKKKNETNPHGLIVFTMKPKFYRNLPRSLFWSLTKRLNVFSFTLIDWIPNPTPRTVFQSLMPPSTTWLINLEYLQVKMMPRDKCFGNLHMAEHWNFKIIVLAKVGGLCCLLFHLPLLFPNRRILNHKLRLVVRCRLVLAESAANFLMYSFEEEWKTEKNNKADGFSECPRQI
jgi:hypothetical protein